jgi:hypothetical protein
MKVTTKTACALLFLAAISNSALAGQLLDSQSANLYVKDVHISAANPAPDFWVKSDGKGYTHVSNDGKKETFAVNVAGSCRNTRWVSYASAGLYKNKNSGSLVAHEGFPISGPKRKTFSTGKRVELRWKPDSAVGARAVQACRNYMQSAKQSGQSVADILAEDHTLKVDSGLYGVFTLSCADLLTSGKKHAFEKHPMTVVCQGSGVKGKPGLVKAKPFAISQVSLKPKRPSYIGTCPKDFKFLAYIKTNSEPGKFRYRFRNHHGVSSAWKTKTATAGYNFVAFEHVVKLQDIKVNQQAGVVGQAGQQVGGGLVVASKFAANESPWLQLEVQNIADNKQYSSKANYSYQCIQPKTGELNLAVIPGQGKADLLVKANSFHLGSKGVNSANELVIGADEATGRIAGMCSFRMRYDILNQGNADAVPTFTTKTSRDGIALHSASTSGLKSGQARTLSGSVKLKSGDNILMIHTDNANKVEESNEANNVVRIHVEVKGDCGSGNTGRAGRQPNLPQRSGEGASDPRTRVR